MPSFLGGGLMVTQRPRSSPSKERHMKWTKPQYQDLRFGFEITMYISAR